MAQKNQPTPRKTALIRVPIPCHDQLARLAKRRGVSMCAMVDMLVGAEVDRVKTEKRRVREFEEAGL